MHPCEAACISIAQHNQDSNLSEGSVIRHPPHSLETCEVLKANS